MSYDPRRSKSVVACVEMMEARQLLSASLAPAAKKAPPTIPSITGETFTGTATAGHDKVALSITFDTESAKGALTSSVLFEGDTLSATGTVKKTRALTIKGKDEKVNFVLSGSLNTALDKFTGKYTDSDKNGSIKGPFSMTLIVPD
jgi:hypothetical protein